MNKIALFTALALIGSLLGACQSDADRLAQAQRDLRAAYAASLEEEQAQKEKAVKEQIRKYVEDTPDLYRISWNVCGDYSGRLHNGVRCSITKIPKEKGYVDPVYVWAANEKQFINKKGFIRGFLLSGLFVKSRGCLNVGKPREEQLYHVKDFMIKKGDATPSLENVKIEVLSRAEKQEVVEQAFRDAEVENYALTNFGVSATTGMIPTGQKSCLTPEEWKIAPP
ncbi:hypothetical protein [Anabaena azotica]|uniref:Uncharacterized protein n=1 Tax=Anabaena azotica FACHB-119 TaxID=947527 RepID=A0ABR8DIC6_9NOST|nr:hypothetical protein [Anabaena azotica]MBD2505538.1 hypothetical protein [Anabaena azotica FACHB-119]